MNTFIDRASIPKAWDCFEKTNEQGWTYEYRVIWYSEGGVILQPISLFREHYTQVQLLSSDTPLHVSFAHLMADYQPSRLAEEAPAVTPWVVTQVRVFLGKLFSQHSGQRDESVIL